MTHHEQALKLIANGAPIYPLSGNFKLILTEKTVFRSFTMTHRFTSNDFRFIITCIYVLTYNQIFVNIIRILIY